MNLVPIIHAECRQPAFMADTDKVSYRSRIKPDTFTQVNGNPLALRAWLRCGSCGVRVRLPRSMSSERLKAGTLEVHSDLS